MLDSPLLAGVAMAATTLRMPSAFQTARLPTNDPATRATSTSATSCTSGRSSCPVTWTRMRLARRATAATSTAPDATSPAAVPADVASHASGNTLLVPVDTGTNGASGHPTTTSRLVPSPPSTTTAPASALARWAAAATVSSRSPDSGSAITVAATPFGRSSRSSARWPRWWWSSLIRIRRAPPSAAPTTARRTSPTFAASETGLALPTSRRMSLPASGLTTMPTVATTMFRRPVWPGRHGCRRRSAWRPARSRPRGPG